MVCVHCGPASSSRKRIDLLENGALVFWPPIPRQATQECENASLPSAKVSARLGRGFFRLLSPMKARCLANGMVFVPSFLVEFALNPPIPTRKNLAAARKSMLNLIYDVHFEDHRAMAAAAKHKAVTDKIPSLVRCELQFGCAAFTHFDFNTQVANANPVRHV